ncbi:hypothetical protein Q7P37_005047 [Cladosporium fusiforme]
MGRTLLDLPSELIAGVFQCLDDVDIFAGREANKQLERASFSLFAKRFFRKKGYMITTPSIKVLKSVAAHEQLRPYVQHVWFNPDCFTFGALEFIKPDNDFKKANPYEENRKGEQLPFFTADEQNRYEAYSACIEDYQRLIYSEEELARELTTAFSTLPNLKAVGMRRSDQHSPWGWSHIKDAVGHDPRDLGDIPDSPSFMLSSSTQLYIALMKSLGTSGAKIQRLYTDAIEIDDIPPQTLPQDVVHAACNSVLYLEINATKGNLLTVPIPSTIITPRRSQTTSGLAKLLAATSRLRELGLMVFPDRKQSHLIAPQPQEPSSWRQTYPYKTISHLSKSVELGNLRRLKLEKLTLSSEILLTFLRPSAQHLTSLKLRDIRLLPDNEEAPNTLSPEIKPWRAIFSFLSTSTPRLSYLLLYHLSHATGGIRFVPNLPANPPQDPHDSDETLSNEGDFTDYENIAVEVGMPHSDPGLLGPERRRELVRAREAVRERVEKLVEGHWYGRNVFGYDMDETVWHTDTSDEEW